VGETVAPLYVDQSRDALSADKTVFQEITDDLEEIVLGVILNSIHTHHYAGFFFPSFSLSVAEDLTAIKFSFLRHHSF
jgi:hypothetical protein